MYKLSPNKTSNDATQNNFSPPKCIYRIKIFMITFYLLKDLTTISKIRTKGGYMIIKLEMEKLMIKWNSILLINA